MPAITVRIRTVSTYCSGLSPLQDDAPRLVDAAKQLDVGGGAIAGERDGLALDAGLIRREADQHDGRRSLLVLTAEGTTALTRIREFRRRVIAEATATWSETDRAALARLLPRFVRDFASLTG